MSKKCKIIICDKRILLIILFLMLIQGSYLHAQKNWVWSDPIRILTHGTTPDFDIDRKNSHLHVVSMKEFGGGVSYTELDSLGNIIVDAKVIDNNDEGGIHYGATIAVDQNGHPHICYRRHLVEPWHYHIYYTYRTDNGWSNPKLIAANVRRGYLVRMDIDRDNRVHLIISSQNDLSFGKVTYYQIQNGNVISAYTQTITDPQSAGQVLLRLDSRFELEASLDGDVHIVLGRPSQENGKITYFYSHDKGGGFTKWGQLQSSDCQKRTADPDVFLDQTGKIYFCYGTSHDLALNGEPSLRFIRMSEKGVIQEHNIVNHPGSMVDTRWGLGSIAADDNGEYVVATYLSKSGGKLWARTSNDGGDTWGTPKMLSESCGGQEGRNKHLIRACRNHFYVVYPENNPLRVAMRMIHFGDYDPVASAGGPYSGKEGETIELNMSASSDTGWYAGISEYAWDWDQDGKYDFKTQFPKVPYTFIDNFTGNAVLKVTDNSGKVDYDIAYFNIVNIPPTVDAGGEIVCEEGDTIQFSAEVEDPGDDPVSYVWNFTDGNYSYEPTPTYVYTDDDIYNVTVQVDDGDGGIGMDEVTVHVNNCDPVADAGGPYQGVIQSNILLTAKVYDKGVSDSIIYKRWDLDNDDIFEFDGYTAVVNYEQAGKYVVWFKAGDDDGGVDLDSAVVLVSCESPYIDPIPDQTIDEGGIFQGIILDDYVYDQDNTKDQMKWSFWGNENLNVSINERILHVDIPDIDWWGDDNITLMVTDPVDNRDTCEVLFTVNAVNDFPQWISMDNFSFKEDDSLVIEFQDFYNQVIDIDDDFEDLDFTIENSRTIQWTINHTEKTICFFAPHNWFGTEELDIVVEDTSGARDKMTTVISVYDDKQDPPEPFTLIRPMSYVFQQWPDTITFLWHSTTDPDSESYIFYKWELRSQGGFSVIDEKVFLNEEDTIYNYLPDTTLPASTYLWKVTAYDESNNSFKVENPGSITLEKQTKIEEKEFILPDGYKLRENYPNPFNPETKIRYELPAAGNVSINIYNIMGQHVRTLIDGYKEAGCHQVIWDGRNDDALYVPSGMYIYIMRCGSHMQMQKALLMK